MQKKAVENFRSGLNCAQSVLASFSDRYGVDNKTALSLSCAFGGGMGRLQETCGAVTGSFMVLGLHNCRKYSDNKERKDKTYAMVQEFDRQFRNIHGTLKCKDLLQIDLRTPEGQKSFHDDNLGPLICEQCIADAVQIVEKLTADQ